MHASQFRCLQSVAIMLVAELLDVRARFKHCLPMRPFWQASARHQNKSVVVCWSGPSHTKVMFCLLTWAVWPSHMVLAWHTTRARTRLARNWTFRAHLVAKAGLPARTWGSIATMSMMRREIPTFLDFENLARYANPENLETFNAVINPGNDAHFSQVPSAPKTRCAGNSEPGHQRMPRNPPIPEITGMTSKTPIRSFFQNIFLFAVGPTTGVSNAPLALCCSAWPTFCRTPANVRRNRRNIGRVWATYFGPTSAEIGRISSQHRLVSVETGPNEVEFGPSSVEVQRKRPNTGQFRSRFGRSPDTGIRIRLTLVVVSGGRPGFG